MEHRQGAQHNIGRLEQKRRPQPAVVDHARGLVLRDLWHPRGAAGVEIGGNPVIRAVGKGQLVGRHARDFGPEILDRGRVADRVLRADQRHNQLFQTRQIGDKINLQHGLDTGGELHRLGHLLRKVGLGERLQRDHHLCPGFPQDGADLFGFQKRVDRVHDPRHRAAQQCHRRFQRIRQHECHDILLPNPQRPEKVCGPRHLAMQFGPAQRDGLRLRPGQQLIADRRAAAMCGLGACQIVVHRAGNIAVGPCGLGLDSLAVRKRCEIRHSFLP